jgi:DGQHR domain-containing protein
MIKQINNVDYVVLLCQKIEQPIGALYSTSIPWSIIKTIAYTEPRILMGIDENGKEEYIGIQRVLSPERQKDIKNYVNKDSSATFPSSIIINIPLIELDIIPVNIEVSLPQITIDDINDPYKNIPNSFNEVLNLESTFIFVFPYKKNVAQIIDGQHRMSGFENLEDSIRFDLPVTIFVDQLIEKQAEIFSTINGNQTRVTPSLVFDLFNLSSKRSPYKVANEIVKLLNESENSPLKNWIRILGKSNEYYSGYITQSTVVKNLLTLYSGNIKQAEEDKRLLALGKEPPLIPTLTTKDVVFRDFFIGKEDEIIYKAISNFFSAAKQVYIDEWSKEKSILKKTVGFTAMFKVFENLAKKGKSINKLSESYFVSELTKYKNVSFDDILLSSKGINQLYERFNLD